jgi:glycosyltransferase involved in cell wall biosynthesis
MLFFRKRDKQIKPAIFINCHSDFGGAERRFARIFNEHLSTKTNIKLISNKSTFNILSDRKLVTLKNNTLILPGGFKKAGRLYQLHHVVNFAFLLVATLRNKITHIHYPVDPSLYSLFHSFFLSPLGITYSLSIVDSSRVKEDDFSSVRHYIWKKSIKHCSGIDFLSKGIEENVTKIFRTSLGQQKTIGISPCSFTDYSLATYSENKDYDLVMMCRLHPKKGHDLFFSALKIIKNRGKHTKIAKIGIFGAGPLSDQLKSEASNLTGFDISFGNTDTPINIFAKSKFLLSLQEDENYPSQAILEALSTGTQIIATDVGETYKIVTPEVGTRVPRDPELLADCILSSIEKYHFDKNKFNTLNSFVTSNHNPTKFGDYLHTIITDSANLIKS